MAWFALRRIGLGLVVLVLVSLVTWVIFATALNPLWSFFQTPHAPIVLEITKRAHLHDPVLLRWWHWLLGIFTGQALGREVVSNEPVWPQVRRSFAITLELVAYASVLIVAGSVLVGVVSARRKGKPADVSLRTFSYLAWSVPAFLLALLLQHLFVWIDDAWGWAPFAFGGPPTPGAGFLDWLQHMTLPAVAVALGFVGVYGRYLRSSLLLTLDAPYSIVARGKGLPERTVVRRYALRNALVPFVTVIAIEFGTIVAASLAADYVFGLHGLVSLFLSNGLLNGDPYMIEAPIVLSAAIVVIASIVGDVVCASLDPRIRLN